MALIYIVEDDQNIREIESFALKNSGYTIMDFECAKDFYHQLAEKVPDCILLDIMLPDEDGLEILSKDWIWEQMIILPSPLELWS